MKLYPTELHCRPKVHIEQGEHRRADIINAPSSWAALPGVLLGRIYIASLVKQHQGLHIKAKYHKKMLQEAQRHKADRQIAFKLVCKAWHQAADSYPPQSHT
ncbi:hypothetical protein WJX77_002947 [Trebouxia sp. C0004]